MKISILCLQPSLFILSTCLSRAIHGNWYLNSISHSRFSHVCGATLLPSTIARKDCENAIKSLIVPEGEENCENQFHDPNKKVWWEIRAIKMIQNVSHEKKTFRGIFLHVIYQFQRIFFQTCSSKRDKIILSRMIKSKVPFRPQPWNKFEQVPKFKTIR